MKIKINFLSIVMLLVLFFPLMVACGGDDNEGSSYNDSDLISRAVGTWMCTQSTDISQGEIYQGIMVGKEITINADGTYTSTAQSFGYTGTYTINGNIITAKSNNGSTFVFTVSISGDKMTWDGTASNGVTFNYIFIKEGVTNPQTTIAITNEMISGTAWKLKSFTIDRGTNNSIQNDKTIIFRTDGSCEGFHSMENAWRINNGRIETYYKETNEPMYVYTLLSQSGDNVTIRMNGTLDDDLQATLALTKVLYEENQTSTVEESFFTSKEHVLALRNTCYYYCSAFEDAQLKLEKIRTNNSTVHSITASSSEIQEAWETGYTAIRNINTLLDHKDSFSSFFTSQEYNELLAEVRFLRSFIYYNLTVLWGDVPLIRNAYVDVNESTPRYDKNTVLDFALREVTDVISNLSSQNDRLKISHDAGLMLKAEIEMTMGDSNKAIVTLNQISSNNYIATRSVSTKLEQYFIWALSQSSQQNTYCPIYTLMHHQLYLYEITGNTEGLMLPTTDTNSDDLPDNVSVESYWLQSNYLDYGYWATLKRIGKAQTVTGCSNYELLMPIPANEIIFNSAMTQNPGY